MQCISNEYDTLNLFTCNYTNQNSRGSTSQARDIPLHPTPTHTHLHHREVPILGCNEKTAAPVLVSEEEQVAAALLDEQLW